MNANIQLEYSKMIQSNKIQKRHLQCYKNVQLLIIVFRIKKKKKSHKYEAAHPFQHWS